MDNFVGRQFCTLSSKQKEIIFGTLLGDGRLECRSKQGTARLRIHHGAKQKELVFWKYYEFKNLSLRQPRLIKSWVNPREETDYYSYYFHTKTLSELGEFYRLFYRRKTKIFPKSTIIFLTPLALAVWYMDDGCYHNSSIILNTQNFTLNEQEQCKKILFKKFGVFSTIAKDRNKFRIIITRQSVNKFLKIVRRNVIPSLTYKIVPVTTSFIKK